VDVAGADVGIVAHLTPGIVLFGRVAVHDDIPDRRPPRVGRRGAIAHGCSAEPLLPANAAGEIGLDGAEGGRRIANAGARRLIRVDGTIGGQVRISRTKLMRTLQQAAEHGEEEQSASDHVACPITSIANLPDVLSACGPGSICAGPSPRSEGPILARQPPDVKAIG